jgi:hypothetical protein
MLPTIVYVNLWKYLTKPTDSSRSQTLESNLKTSKQKKVSPFSILLLPPLTLIVDARAMINIMSPVSKSKVAVEEGEVKDFLIRSDPTSLFEDWKEIGRG